MNRINILILISFSILISCEKEYHIDENYYGNAFAIKNGVTWEAELYASNNEPYNQGIDIMFRKFNNQGYLRESLFFSKVPLSTGTYQLRNTDVRDIDSLIGADFHTSLSDGDVGNLVFEINEKDTIDDFIKIESIKGEWIKGSFQVSMVEDPFPEPLPGSGGLKQITFHDGIFETRIVE